MRGYVVKKGSNWYAVVYQGVDPGTGKERRRWVAAGKRRCDAEKLVTELVQRRNDGEPVSDQRLRLSEYLIERWLPIQETRLRQSTFDSYRRNVHLHVLPALGRLRLDKLTVEHLERFYAELLVAGRKDGSGRIGLSPKTVRSIHLVLHKALSDAQRKGLVARNAAAIADAPTVGARKRAEIKAWNATQLNEFLRAIGAHRLAPAFRLAACTGMRRGEVLGLRWQDIDFAAARLSVRQALISVAYETHISDVKSGAGRRTIDLDEETIEGLSAWRNVRRDEGAEPLAANALVFAKVDGQPIHPDVFSQILDRVVARLDVPRISLHDLRHTHATLLLQAGVPVKVVSERLGHASAAFTMTVYQHVLPGMQADAARAFAEIIDNGRGA